MPGDPESLCGPLANSVDMSLISFPSRIFTSQVGVLRRCAGEKALDVTVWREDLFPSLGTFFAASGEHPAGPASASSRCAQQEPPSLPWFVIASRKEDCRGQPVPTPRGSTPTPGSAMEGELGSWESERDNSPGKPKIALAKGGGCPGHQGLGRSL